MPLGDGATWDETTPTDATVGIQIDDYLRDVRIGIRARLANEHEWPSSQSATSQAGAHKFMTLQVQSVKPTLSGTQVSAIYQDTSGNFCYENTAGSVYNIMNQTGFAVATGLITTTGNLAVSAAFGAWTSINVNQIYQAGSDGIVSATINSASNWTIDAYSDSSTPPTVRRAHAEDQGTTAKHFSFPVKKGDYYKLTTSQTLSVSEIYFIPLGV